MANALFVNRVIFQEIDKDGNLLDATYGVKASDDYACGYDDTVESKDVLLSLTKDEMLDLAKNISEEMCEAVDAAKLNGTPIYMDGERYIESADNKM